MRVGIATIVLLLAAVAPAGSSCAMNAPSTQLVDCRVIGGDKLPAESGGADVLCAAIRQAAAEQAPGARFAVEVKVRGESMLGATITTANGTRLPEQKLAISDRALTRGSLERFARTLGGVMAQAGSQ
jgi:hypothetical protein